jgi:hypothetical protein
MKKLLSLILCAALVCCAVLPCFAAGRFDDGAYASVLTGSDFQALGTEAYERFGRLLGRMKADGLETPDSMLVGGDYTKILFDYAIPGISQIRGQLTAQYPDADPERVVCIQGNHDNPASGFTKTGFYDMGIYNLYVINEDDFPWLQGLRPGIDLHVKKIAADLEEKLNGLISAGDMRPVIVMTHLPLHHTSRVLYSDNKYASYIFNVLNAAGRTLDIVFLFGHQHSGDYDDYIGGSVNFMAPGDTIRVPRTDWAGEDCYTNETLTFTYTNCGYVGYSDNTASDTSTNVLTLGVLRFTEREIRVIKYTEDGCYRADTVARKHTASGQTGGGVSRLFEKLWVLENNIFLRIFEIFLKIRAALSF